MPAVNTCLSEGGTALAAAKEEGDSQVHTRQISGTKWLIKTHINPQAARNRLQLLTTERHRTGNREKTEGHKAALRPRSGTREGELNTDAFQEQPVCWTLTDTIQPLNLV